MASAIVNVLDQNKIKIRGRMLLDTCATANFVTDSFVKKLLIKKSKCSISIGVMNDLSTQANAAVSITFESIYNDNYRKTLKFFVVPCISSLVPNERIPREKLNIPKNIQLADPEFQKPANVDMLIGAGPTLSLFSIGQINLSNKNTDCFMQKTRLGWIIGGEIGVEITNANKNNISKCLLTNLKDDLDKFWNVEEVTSSRVLSVEEQECEIHFINNIKRDVTGKYIVALPFKPENFNLGSSREIALKRLMSLRKRFKYNPELEKFYTNVILEYIKLGHMTLITSPSHDGCFLPHHAVFKDSSNTTQVRVVFDASAPTLSGKSLNDVLMTGPTIQDDLFSLLLRFRTYRYVLTADIEKMYRQFLVREEDRKFQKILWYEGENIVEYQLNTITFGFTSSPFLAIRCLHQLVDDEGSKFPLASKVIKNDLYVDNLITGANTLEEAKEICEQTNQLLKLGHLNMRQWASNERKILKNVNPDNIDKEFRLDTDCTLKTLGTYWKSKDDIFIYTVNTPNIKIITKRKIFSEVAKIFDPLGLLGPVILYAKSLVQDLWQRKLDWDESIPSDLYHKWVKFSSQLNLLKSIAFPRHILIPDAVEIQLHGFCDASMKGYGACFYIRSKNERGDIYIRLLCSKSKVAPLSNLTIPRLELCGALLLARLFNQINATLNLKFDKICFWTDSEIVLHWLNTPSNSLKTFVSNRVNETQSLTDIRNWRHIRSYDNPADSLSRGQLPAEFIKNSLWTKGPNWLNSCESTWPQLWHKSIIDIPESRKIQCLSTTTINLDILKRYSSFSKLKRIVAILCRFLSYKNQKGPLCLNEINTAEIKILKLVQALTFPKEINDLKQNKLISTKSNILNLDPFIDKDGLLRVGGRLTNANIEYSSKHPIILPSSHFITDLIIKEYHVRNYHSGVQTTLYAIRQKFWLINGRNQIKKIIRQCVNCFRVKPKLAEYKMGNLPDVRVTSSRTFLNVGIDYCGPFYIKEKKFRNRSIIKIYVSVFVCMAIKAIHIEVVSDLTSDAFIGALKRFIARRGKPASIHCDNATNFVGAKNDLRELYILLQSNELKEKITNFSIEHEIEFKFIPPAAPFFGGLWESSVKSFKHHFKRVAKNPIFTFEEFNTLAIEIESILNSRPINTLSSDPNDPLPLTPSHFLIGDILTSIPERNTLSIPDNRLSSWELISKVKQDFWKRWTKEFLNELNTRQKWKTGHENVKEGMVVLIHDDDVPSMKWNLGIIQRIYPGNDGIIRTVILKTAKGHLKRSVRKIAPLPINY